MNGLGRRAFALGGLTVATGVAARPPGDTYTRAEIDAQLAATPLRVCFLAGWPATRPAARPVEFIGPDHLRDTVPGWAADDDTYLGF